jgi:hypothetical protein
MKAECQKHRVELSRYQGKENVCFICENERQANQRHLAEQREIEAVKAKHRNNGVF